MNHTEHGNIAVGADGSLARAQANEQQLSSELRRAVCALYELRERFVPNDPTLEHVAEADHVLSMHRDLLLPGG